MPASGNDLWDSRRPPWWRANRDPDEFVAIVRWDTTENYNKNSERPETDAWYQKFRANLIADPEWFDGTTAEETKA
jgi:hypothetical protein